MAYAGLIREGASTYASNLVCNMSTLGDQDTQAARNSGGLPSQAETPEWIALYHSDKTFAAFVNEVFALYQDEDEEVPPSRQVVDWILESAVLSKRLLAQTWSVPRVSTDDQGGIRLSWRNAERELRAVVPAGASSERYIYWQIGDKFGGIPNFSSATLYERLRWVNERASR